MNNLEALLNAAFSDPTLRVSFYSMLLESDVCVVYQSSESEITDGVLKKGQKITLTALSRKDGTKVIPFFTSDEVMKRVIKEEVKYIKINCREFFDMIKGSDAVINPFLENAKEFSAGEIEALLNGFEDNGVETEEQTETRDILSQHEKEPRKLIEAIKGYMTSDKRVKKGYIAVYDNPVLKKELKTLIIVQCTGGFDEIKKEIAAIGEKENDSGYPIEILKYDEGNSLCEIADNRYSPFYIKKFLGLF